MNIHHLELFYFVAKFEGITSAVRKMPYGIQQPAVSGQILKLEEKLGIKLFNRRPFALTPAGGELYEYIYPFFCGLGDLEEKLLPYLRPLYDAMDEVLGPVEARKLVETGAVEIAPLAYMRGRTLGKCFALLDEAQNTTRSQMMMFLTRLGEGSKMVVTGDLTQVDLPPRQESGLIEARRILKKVPGLYFHEFDHDDVVRHPLVSAIISAYQPPSENH